MKYPSWGNTTPHKPVRVKPVRWRHQALPTPIDSNDALLAYGLGRSYGDSCLNNNGTLLPMAEMNRFIEFDDSEGLLTCEAGVTLEQILELTVPQGWFLAVTPGTKYVTVGGAIANDIHGKNHHKAGTFGTITKSLKLLRSDGGHLSCSRKKNEELFNATVGGLGLTGLMTQATIQLKRIDNPFIAMETVKFRSVEEFVKISEQSDENYEYTVAWIDCSSGRNSVGRGLFMRGNHAPPQFGKYKWKRRKPWLSVPFTMPGFVINPLTISMFNFLYFHKQRREISSALVPYEPFFYPLDAVNDWNRIYGGRGFFQYQCVVPTDTAGAVTEIIRKISDAGYGSFLAVLKKFGDVPSPGLLSFPRPGYTLAIDITNSGEKTLQLLDALDEITELAGGALYPAKDERMSKEMFKRSYPRLSEFKPHVDPAFASDFWKRMECSK